MVAFRTVLLVELPPAFPPGVVGVLVPPPEAGVPPSSLDEMHPIRERVEMSMARKILCLTDPSAKHLGQAQLYILALGLHSVSEFRRIFFRAQESI